MSTATKTSGRPASVEPAPEPPKPASEVAFYRVQILPYIRMTVEARGPDAAEDKYRERVGIRRRDLKAVVEKVS